MNLICYLSNGFPTLEHSKQMAENYVQAGCDVIEIDFPSSNPFLENDFIAGRMKKALEDCDDYTVYMNEMKQVKSNLPGTKFIVLVYENTVLDIGLTDFIHFCKTNDFGDVILVGIQKPDVKDKMIQSGLRVSCYIQFHMPENEIESAVCSNGFIYLQAKPSHGEINPKFPTLKDCISRLRNLGISRPIYCGVGIRTADDVQSVKKSGADGVFVGSTILKLHDNIPEMKNSIRKLKLASQ
ncbi:MAG: tryptophan synthase subunit alpha [Sporolactobacillus sp.]